MRGCWGPRRGQIRLPRCSRRPLQEAAPGGQIALPRCCSGRPVFGVPQNGGRLGWADRAVRKVGRNIPCPAAVAPAGCGAAAEEADSTWVSRNYISLPGISLPMGAIRVGDASRVTNLGPFHPTWLVHNAPSKSPFHIATFSSRRLSNEETSKRFWGGGNVSTATRGGLRDIIA